jgi:hypothetical protein
MSDWELLLQILEDMLTEWPRELTRLARSYVRVRVYEWQCMSPQHGESIIKCTISKREIGTTYVDESSHPNWGFFYLRSTFSLGAGPRRWAVDVSFRRRGDHCRLGIGISRARAEDLHGVWLYPKQNALEIGVGSVRMQFFHYQNKKYRIYLTIEKEKEIARVEFRDCASDAMQLLGTMSLSTLSLDDLYPAVTIVTDGNGCSITLVDE